MIRYIRNWPIKASKITKIMQINCNVLSLQGVKFLLK